MRPMIVRDLLTSASMTLHSYQNKYIASSGVFILVQLSYNDVRKKTVAATPGHASRCRCDILPLVIHDCALHDFGQCHHELSDTAEQKLLRMRFRPVVYRIGGDDCDPCYCGGAIGYLLLVHDRSCSRHILHGRIISDYQPCRVYNKLSVPAVTTTSLRSV